MNRGQTTRLALRYRREAETLTAYLCSSERRLYSDIISHTVLMRERERLKVGTRAIRLSRSPFRGSWSG